jgi:hypothetical protein
MKEPKLGQLPHDPPWVLVVSRKTPQQPHVTRRFGGGGLGKTLLPSLHPRSALFSASLLVRPSILALPRSQPMWSIGRQ